MSTVSKDIIRKGAEKAIYEVLDSATEIITNQTFSKSHKEECVKKYAHKAQEMLVILHFTARSRADSDTLCRDARLALLHMSPIEPWSSCIVTSENALAYDAAIDKAIAKIDRTCLETIQKYGQ